MQVRKDARYHVALFTIILTRCYGELGPQSLVVSYSPADHLSKGLITGRTTAYLIDEEKSDIAAKKRVAEVASHEVAHQWYVNL
jgi:Peptidase family M1 domain